MVQLFAGAAGTLSATARCRHLDYAAWLNHYSTQIYYSASYRPISKPSYNTHVLFVEMCKYDRVT